MQGRVTKRTLRALVVADEERSRRVDDALGRTGREWELAHVGTPGLLVAALGQGSWDLIVCVPDLSQLRLRTCLALILDMELTPPVIVVGEESDRLAAYWVDEETLAEGGIHFCLAAQLSRAVRQSMREIGLRQAVQRLQETHERSLEILDRISDVAYAHDTDGYFTFVNGAAERLGGYAPGELIGRNFADVVAPEYIEVARSGPSSDLDEPMVYPLEVVTKDGRWIRLEITSWLVVRDGVPVGSCGIGRLLTAEQTAGSARPALPRDDVRVELLAALTEMDALREALADEFENREGDASMLLAAIRANVMYVQSLVAEAIA